MEKNHRPHKLISWEKNPSQTSNTPNTPYVLTFAVCYELDLVLKSALLQY